jgi:ribosomal 50S subunit-associated protein YjgA (DUF615 family)
MTVSDSYLDSARKQFAYYKVLGDKTFEQLSEEALIWRFNSESNSIATIVKHMWGNMLSRWTDFLSTDGEKEWRHRDAEFDNDVASRADMLRMWEEGWACLFRALDALSGDDLERIVYIRNMGHTVMEAINRQLAHYSYHVGQIVYIGKLIRAKDWKCLSIPRGLSSSYNAAKFAQDKRREHFTDEILKKDSTE